MKMMRSGWTAVLHRLFVYFLVLLPTPALTSVCPASGGAPGPLPGFIAERIPGFGGIGIPSNSMPTGAGVRGALSEPLAASGSEFDCAGSTQTSEPASLARATPSLAAGNPVDVASGNKYEQVSDVRLARPDAMTWVDATGLPTQAAAGVLAGGGLVINFARYYNSGSEFALSMGVGWTHSYETRMARLRRATTSATALTAYEIQILQADGRRMVFSPVAKLADGTVRYGTGDLADGLVEERLSNGSQAAKPARIRARDSSQPAAPADDATGSNAQHAGTIADSDEAYDGDARSRPWVWRWPGGRRLYFDRQGRLARVIASDLDTIELTYDAQGRLSLIGDRQGRRLKLGYAGARLQSVRLPDGAEVRYDYDQRGRLVIVQYPGGNPIRYHYEDGLHPHRLTGTTYPDGRRSRHRYDAQGRVVSTQPDERNADGRVDLQYSGQAQSDAGVTLVKSGDGEGRYKWRRLASGQHVIVESSGSGCQQCPPVGWSLRWNERGQPLELGDWRLRYDALGRLTELSYAVQKSSQSTDHEQLRWRLTYSSAEPLASPTRIDAPSVIAGRRRITEFRHNGRDQTVLRVERGHVPEGDGSHERFRAVRIKYHASGPARGKPASISLLEGQGTPNDGTDRLLGVSELAAPAALQRYRWDDRRRLASVDYGHDVHHDIERDELARPVLERLPDLRERRWRYDAAWLPEFISPHAATGAAARIPATPKTAVRTPNPTSKALPIGLSLHAAGIRHFVDADGQHTTQRLDDFGRVVEERIDGRLWRHVQYDSAGRPAVLTRPDGVVEHLRFDAAGRLRERERHGLGQSELTSFEWRGLRLEALRHPHQSTRLQSDLVGRITHLSHTLGDSTLHLAQHYDADGRLVRRDLGDGRALIYGYDAQGRPQSVGLQTRGAGRPIELLSVDYRPDGLPAGESLGRAVFSQRHYDEQRRLTRLTWQTQGLLGRTNSGLSRRLGMNGSGGFMRVPIEDWSFEWDRHGRIVAVARGRVEDRYGFDAWGRIVVRERHERGSEAAFGAQGRLVTRALHREYFAYSPAGHLHRRLDRQGQSHRHVHPATARSGQTLQMGNLEMHYGLSDRIETITRVGQPAQPIAHYRYNALGERVSKTWLLETGATQTTYFLYHGRQLIAEMDEQGQIRRHYVYWAGRIAAIIDPNHGIDGERIYFVLGDHLGSPRSVTDASGSVVWQVDVDLFGGVAETRGKFEFAIRFPGQYFDPETGLHDNYQRSYDPRAGRYLEPDPMGLAGAWNRYAYAGGNPVQAIDPLGLILFAFDGTGNTDPARAPDTLSNVARLYSLYDTSQRHYMSGVGIPLPDHGIDGGRLDALDAGSARQRVDLMLERLHQDVDRSATGSRIQVDVIGFSRGAAMARDFANTVAQRIRSGHYTSMQRCVSLNFIGLWDTVAQFGLDGQANDRWNLSIPPEAHVVVHAVAVNEHRALFPAESILPAPGQDSGRGRRLELGFIGDHADIGGSHSDGDLSDIALSWMYDQAIAAGLPLAGLSSEWRTISNPLLHDARALISPGSDRMLRIRDERGKAASEARQRDAAVAGMNWAASQPMVGYFPYRLRGGDGRATLAGRVDMQAYGSWLSEQYALDVVY